MNILMSPSLLYSRPLPPSFSHHLLIHFSHFFPGTETRSWKRDKNYFLLSPCPCPSPPLLPQVLRGESERGKRAFFRIGGMEERATNVLLSLSTECEAVFVPLSPLNSILSRSNLSFPSAFFSCYPPSKLKEGGAETQAISSR